MSADRPAARDHPHSPKRAERSTPIRTSRADRFRRLCLALPETYEKEAWGHPTFRVGRDKMFASMATDGTPATCKADPDERPALLAPEAGGRYFLPAYVGSKGWVGIQLDHAGTDWDEVVELVRTSYVLIAPKTLSRGL